MIPSEPVPRGDLRFAHSAGGDHLTERRRTEGSVDRSEISVVEHIRGRETQLQALHFLNLNGLGQSHVKIDRPWADDDVSAGIAERTGRRGEGCGVEPLADARIAASDGLAGNDVPPRGAGDATLQVRVSAETARWKRHAGSHREVAAD